MQIKNKQNSSVRRPAYTTWAFTLVELIVVITILAILWTIAFISLQWYSAQARDSKRLSDISNIKKSVELFSLNTGKYPEPDDSVTMSYSWEALRYQWIVWDQVSTNVSRNLQEKPVDPSTGNEYTYSTTYSQTEYEVLGLYESDLIWFLPHPNPLLTGEGTRALVILSSNAEMQDYPKIDWNYNGIYIKTPSFYVPTPSIINAEIVSNDDLDNDMIKSQIVTGWDNLPWVSTWWLDVTFSYYEWTMTSDSTEEEKIALVEAIQTAYSWSSLASNTMYSDLLSRTSTWEMEDFVDLVVLNRIGNNTTSNSTKDSSSTILTWNDEFTKLLLHADWAWDISSSNHDLNFYWNAQISSTWKFGSGYYFDWNWDYIEILDSDDWNFWNWDFTVDLWIKPSTVWEMWWISTCQTASNRFFWWRYSWNFKVIANWVSYVLTPWASPSTIKWTHIWLVRKEWTFYFYEDWILIWSEYTPIILQDYSSNLWIAYLFTSAWSRDKRFYNWYMDEIRISKWIARTLDPDDYMYDPEWDWFDVPTQEYWN